MNSKEKAHPGVAAPERAAGADFAGHVPDSNFTTDAGKRQEGEFTLVSDLLHQGRENGLTLHDLVRLTGLDEREIRRKIHSERKAGKLIMADCKNGYFFPESSQDIKSFIRSMNGRAKEIASISRAAEDALAKISGQGRMNGW